MQRRRACVFVQFALPLSYTCRYEKAAQLAPSYYKSHYNLGRLLVLNAGALSSRTSHKSAEGSQRLLQEKADLEVAVTALRRSLDINERNHDATFHLGVALLRLKVLACSILH